MHSSLRNSLVVVIALIASSGWANVKNLQQSFDGQTLAVGGLVSPNATVQLTGEGGQYSCWYPYRIEFEVVETTSNFGCSTDYYSWCQNGNTTLSPQLTSPASNCNFWPYPTYTFPAADVPTAATSGKYKWQAKQCYEYCYSYGGYTYCYTYCDPWPGNWTTFNSGGTAWEVDGTRPDLLVASVSISNVVATSSDLSFVVNAVFMNRGIPQTTGLLWKAFLSDDRVLDPSDTLIYTSTNSLTVNGNKTTVAESSPTLSVPKPSTNKYVVVQADPDNVINEILESNNVGSIPDFFSPGVDIVATSITSVPANAQPGQNVTINLTLFNQGVEVPSAAVSYRIFVTDQEQATTATTKIVDSGSITIGAFEYVRNLPVTFSLKPNVQGGDVYWGVEFDYTRTITETVENNNVVVSAAQTHVQQADFRADFADLVHMKTELPIRKADIGFPARFQVDATNKGDYDSFPVKAGVIISRDNTLSLLVDHIFTDVPISAITSGTTNKIDLFVDIPSVDAKGNALAGGDYFFFVYLDSFNEINEIEEADNTIRIVGPVRLRVPTPDYAITSLHTVTSAAGGESSRTTSVSAPRVLRAS
jgi:hypothetical protein